VMLSLIPTLIVFLFAQRRLVEGLTLGSVKG
jgi:ABC-type glycerol-3-phosphate transport system permease component